jgi:hypothetical protein
VSNHATSRSSLTDHLLQQTKLPKGHFACRINISSDATICSAGTGNYDRHPVYAWISINSPFLLREHRGALILIAFLPKVKSKKPYEQPQCF